MKRPIGVWVCLVLVLLMAGLNILTGIDHFKVFQDMEITTLDMAVTYWLFGLALALLCAGWGLLMLKPWGRGLALVLSIIDVIRGLAGLFGDPATRTHAAPAILAGAVVFYFLAMDGTTKESFKPESLY